MTRFVALWRGINVGKAKRVAMVDLRTLLGTLGYGHVRTLLNSGNAVFDRPSASTPKASNAHAQRIRAAVAQHLGVDALVVVKSAPEVDAIIAGRRLSPAASDPSRVLVAFTNDAASLAAIKPLTDTDWGAEELQLGSHAAYLWCAQGIAESQLATVLQRDINTSGTTRNWATLEKIRAMLHDAEA